jgi:DNA-binding beta-propeller fold protein YncE
MRICPRSRPCLAACLLLLASVPLLAAEPVKSDTTSHPHRLMYACLNRDVAVFDMDAGHKFVRWIPLNTDPAKLTEPPVKGDRGAANFRGICADPASGKLWVTYNPTDELICLDLATDRVLWRTKYGKHADSQAITPDGRIMYLPCREDGRWHVLDAQTGEELGAIATGGNPHNTEISPDGSRAFMESLAHPWVFIADVRSREIVGKVGPFSSAVRPFSVSDDGKWVYACVNGLLGFEVGDVQKGEKVARVEAKRPAEREAQLPKAGSPHGCPSHGVGLRPNNAGHKEVWVVDSG